MLSLLFEYFTQQKPVTPPILQMKSKHPPRGLGVQCEGDPLPNHVELTEIAANQLSKSVFECA